MHARVDKTVRAAERAAEAARGDGGLDVRVRRREEHEDARRVRLCGDVSQRLHGSRVDRRDGGQAEDEGAPLDARGEEAAPRELQEQAVLGRHARSGVCVGGGAGSPTLRPSAPPAHTALTLSTEQLAKKSGARKRMILTPGTRTAPGDPTCRYTTVPSMRPSSSTCSWSEGGKASSSWLQVS